MINPLVLIIVLIILGIGVFLFLYRRNIIFPKIKFLTKKSENDITKTLTNVKENTTEKPFLNTFSKKEKTPQENLNEIILAKNTLEKLVEKGWDPDGSTLPLTHNDIAGLTEIITNEKNLSTTKAIPDDIKTTLTSFSELGDINQEIFKAYDQYINYLRLKKIKQEYIDELTQNTLPAKGDRIYYHTELIDENADNTASQLNYKTSYLTPYVETDKFGQKTYFHSKLILHIYAYDIFKNMSILMNSKIYDSYIKDGQKTQEYYKEIRNDSIKLTVYKNMTYALQRAMITENTPDLEKNSDEAWLYSTRNLINADKKYYWKWGTQYYNESLNNKELTEESQANGIAFEIFTNKMTDENKYILWDHFYGKYDDMRNNIDNMKIIFEEKYPQYSPERFPKIMQKIYSDYPEGEDKIILGSLVEEIENLPKYAGFLHPMKPDDTKYFWNSLKE